MEISMAGIETVDPLPIALLIVFAIVILNILVGKKLHSSRRQTGFISLNTRSFNWLLFIIGIFLLLIATPLLMTMKDSPSYPCEAIDDVEERDECYERKYKKRDYSVCDKIQNMKKRNDCYFLCGHISWNLSCCLEMASAYEKRSCITYAAKEAKNISYCDYTSDKYCQLNVIYNIQPRNISLCDKIDNESLIEECKTYISKFL
jgi:hypothetical protein